MAPPPLSTRSAASPRGTLGGTAELSHPTPCLGRSQAASRCRLARLSSLKVATCATLGGSKNKPYPTGKSLLVPVGGATFSDPPKVGHAPSLRPLNTAPALCENTYHVIFDQFSQPLYQGLRLPPNPMAHDTGMLLCLHINEP